MTAYDDIPPEIWGAHVSPHLTARDVGYFRATCRVVANAIRPLAPPLWWTRLAMRAASRKILGDLVYDANRPDGIWWSDDTRVYAGSELWAWRALDSPGLSDVEIKDAYDQVDAKAGWRDNSDLDPRSVLHCRRIDRVYPSGRCHARGMVAIQHPGGLGIVGYTLEGRIWDLWCLGQWPWIGTYAADDAAAFLRKMQYYDSAQPLARFLRLCRNLALLFMIWGLLKVLL